MIRFRVFIVLTFVATALFALGACSDDDPVQPKTDPDYFPFSRAFTWTYQTNAYTEMGVPEVTVKMKIDTLSSTNGIFHWLCMSFPGQPDWDPWFAMLDSANVIYSIGDHPREELVPLFKHNYAASEVVSETITVQGKSYKTVKYDYTLEGIGTVSWWFADGIGLVKEYSEDGVSLFADDLMNGTVLTELVSYTK